MSNSDTFAGWIVLVAILLLFAFGFFIGGWLVQYNIEYWASRIADKPIDVGYYKCCFAGLFIGWNIAIPATLITWIVSLAT